MNCYSSTARGTFATLTAPNTSRETFDSLTAPNTARETFDSLTAPNTSRETFATLTAPNIKANLLEIRQNIAKAQAVSKNAAKHVALLAVSKTQPMDAIEAAAAAGQLQFAENRVQELLPKLEMRPELTWHLIGRLQSNKAKFVADKIAMLHSLDSIGLAAELQKRCAKANRVLPVLVQVNIAEDTNKAGISPMEVADFLAAMADFPLLHVQGLMTIGPIVDNPEEMRPIFAELRHIRQREAARKQPHLDLRHLSMGMSGDYVVAVEEGATIVRVGSSIFGVRG